MYYLISLKKETKRTPMTVDYNPNNQYWVITDPFDSNRIVQFMGLPFPVECVRGEKDTFTSTLLGHIDEDTFCLLRESVSNLSVIGFYDHNTDDFSYRKIFLDLGDKTFFNKNTDSICSLDNILRFTVCGIDEYGEKVEDIKKVSLKNMRTRDAEAKYSTMCFYGVNDPDTRKIVLNNGDSAQIELISDGVHTIRVKLKTKLVSATWLTMYITATKLSEEQCNDPNLLQIYEEWKQYQKNSDGGLKK